MATKGGARPGAGRKKGVPNKRNAETAQAIVESGLTPLEFMMQIVRGEPPKDADAAQQIAFHVMRLDAAKAAAPYVHARLQPVDGKTGSAEVKATVTVRFV